MKRIWMISFVMTGLLLGCSNEETLTNKPTETIQKMESDKESMLSKPVDIQVRLQDDFFEFYGMSLGEEYNTILEAMGEPKEEKNVENMWRYDKVMSYEVGKIKMDIALFRNHIDEITITIPRSLVVDVDSLKKDFVGIEYRLTDKDLLFEKHARSVHYLVQPKEDQWLIIQEKEDDSLVLTSTYTYDFTYLKEMKKIEKPNEMKKKTREEWHSAN